MPPQVNPTNPQPGQVIQPNQPASYDFTQTQPIQPVQPQPVQPAFDPNTFKQDVINGVKDILQTTLQRPEDQTQQTQTQEPETEKQYGKWGEVFQDVDKLVDQKLAARENQAKQTTDQIQQQEQANQAAIDASINELRTAGYLPPVQNKFDANDVGKQAENELIGYAIKLGSTNLAEVAQELKSHHDRGEVFDWQNKNWKQTATPDNSPSMFGTLPVTPDGQIPQISQAPAVPVGYPGFVPGYNPYTPGPRNPYFNPYPAGFNAPVSNGGGSAGFGMQGQSPSVSTLRHSSMDQLVDMFNRTQ